MFLNRKQCNLGKVIMDVKVIIANNLFGNIFQLRLVAKFFASVAGTPPTRLVQDY